MSWTAVSPLPCVSFRPPNQNVGFSNPTKTFCISRRSPGSGLGRHHPRKLMPSRHFRQELPITTTGRCSSTSQGASANEDDTFSQQSQDFNLKNQRKPAGLWMKWKESSDEMRQKLAKLGLAAVLAYGLFDGFTYTGFFVVAFLGYEKSTGKNPAANLKALLGIVILMWTGNNVTRPFRVAGAAALAPFIDEGLRRIQKHFNFPNLVYAFALVVAIVAALCFAVVALLILSRWGK